MRFVELNLLKYGHFDGCDLRFPKGADGDLHIIYGPNEAGKSTTLAAASDFLFGFPHTTRFDFRFDKQLLRVGAVIDADGKQLSLRRRKGNSGTLLSEKDEPVSDALLAGLLKGQTAETFHRMFGLDHTRLRDGGQAILDAKDDVGQAIFAAGSGLVGIAELVESLDGQAKAIWAPRAAANRSYYVAQKAFDEARAKLKASQFKPARWDELRKAVEDAEEALDQFRVQRSALETSRQKIERQRRVLPSVAKRKLVESSLDELAPVPNFPPDASVRFAEIEKAITRGTADKQAAADRVKAATEKLAALVVDDQLLSYSAEIDALKEQRPVVADYLQDLPKRTTERDRLAAQISELQKELGWDLDAPAAIRQKMPSMIQIAEIRELLEGIGAAEAVVSKSEADVEEQKREIAELNRVTIMLRPAADTTGLTAALRFALTKGQVDNNVQAQATALERAKTELQRSIARLAPWSGSIETLQTLAVPAPDKAGEIANRMAHASAELAKREDALEADKDKRRQLDLERNQAVRDDHAVPPEALLQARGERNDSWVPLRAHMLGTQKLEQPEAPVRAFENLVARADELADQRFMAAARSGRLVALAEEIERLDLNIVSGEKKVGAANEIAQNLNVEWSNEITALGVLVSPNDFISWSQRRDVVLAAVAKVQEIEEGVTQAARERDAVREALFNAFAIGNWTAEQNAPTGVLVALAEDRIKTEAGAQQAKDANQRNIEAAQNNLKRAETKRQIAQDELDSLILRWKPALRSMHFDDGVSVAVIRARLALLDELRRAVDDIMGLDHRIETMDANVNSFSSDVAKLATACGCADGSKTATELLGHLVASAGAALVAAQERSRLKHQEDDELEKETAADRVLAQAQERLAPLLQIGNTQDKEVLRGWLADADRRSSQRAALSSLDIEIVSLGDGLDLAQLLDEVREVDPDGLKIESIAIEDQLAELSRQIEEQMALLTAARRDFDSLTGGPDAAVEASEMAFARAEMEVQAESYVRLRTEAIMLKWAIEKYRREKQAPLLGRASALFSTLTLGAYGALMVDNDSDRPRLCGLPAGANRLIPVDGMSEGTVDQLYLALRLAAVEDAVENGINLPFLADDLFINYDDKRAEAGFRVLAELSKKTQVLFFTHHQHLVALSQSAVPTIDASVCRLAA